MLQQIEQIGPKHAGKRRRRERLDTYAGRGPWGDHARDQKAKKKEEQANHFKKGKWGSWKVWDLTLPGARGPAIFVSTFYMVL